MFVTVQGVNIHYNDVGEGEPILCLHGGGPGATAWSNFKQNIPVITGARRRMVMMDMPGYGKSGFPDGSPRTFSISWAR